MAADWAVTFDGVDKTTYVRVATTVVAVSRPLNERATMRLDLLPGFEPDRFADVGLWDGATKLFGGLLFRRKTKGVADREVQRVSACEIYDYSIYADWRYVTEEFTEPVTVKAVLERLQANYLVDYDVTIDPTQLDGVTLAPFTWQQKLLKACLRELSERTGWIVRFDPIKQLKMFAPGSEVSTIDISDDEPNCQDLTIEDPQQAPITLLTGVFGSAAETDVLVEDEFVANGIATSWPTKIRARVKPGSVHVDNGVDPERDATVGAAGEGAEFDFDLDTSTLSAGTYGTPTDGTVLTVRYNPVYPFQISQSIGPSPSVPREFVFTRTDIRQYDVALEAWTQKSSELEQELRLFKWFSREHGWTTGTVATVQHSARGVVSPTLVSLTNVELTLSNHLEWLYTVDGQETTTIQSDSLTMPMWRNLLGGAGASSSGGSGSIGSIVTMTSRGWSHAMGGSDSLAIAMGSPPAMTPIWSSRPYYASHDFSAVVRAFQWARNSGVAVTTQVRRLSDDEIMATSAAVVADERPETPESLTFLAESGEAYVVDVQGDTNEEDVYALADLYPL